MFTTRCRDFQKSFKTVSLSKHQKVIATRTTKCFHPNFVGHKNFVFQYPDVRDFFINMRISENNLSLAGWNKKIFFLGHLADPAYFLSWTFLNTKKNSNHQFLDRPTYFQIWTKTWIVSIVKCYSEMKYCTPHAKNCGQISFLSIIHKYGYRKRHLYIWICKILMYLLDGKIFIDIWNIFLYPIKLSSYYCNEHHHLGRSWAIK